MDEQKKKEILESESFYSFCKLKNDSFWCYGCSLDSRASTGRCADAYYAVKIEEEKAKVEKLKGILASYDSQFCQLDSECSGCSQNCSSITIEIHKVLKEIEG